MWLHSLFAFLGFCILHRAARAQIKQLHKLVELRVTWRAVGAGKRKGERESSEQVMLLSNRLLSFLTARHAAFVVVDADIHVCDYDHPKSSHRCIYFKTPPIPHPPFQWYGFWYAVQILWRFGGNTINEKPSYKSCSIIFSPPFPDYVVW